MTVDEQSSSGAVVVDLGPDDPGTRRAAGRPLRFSGRQPTARRAARSALRDGTIH